MTLILALVLLAGDDPAPMRATSSTLTSAEITLAETQLREWKASRDRLVSGVFVARGRLKVKSPGEDKPDLDEEIEYFCAFDFEHDMIRFDKGEPGTLGKQKAGSKRPDERKGPQAKSAWTRHGTAWDSYLTPSRFIRTPDVICYWFQPGGSVVIREPDARPMSEVSPFDPRCLGFSVMVNLQSDLRFPTLCRYLCEQELTEASREGDTVCKLAWVFGGGGLSREAWLDRTCGYSPVRMETRLGTGQPPQETQTSEASWTQVSGVWVPKSVFIDRRNVDLKDRLELTFKWESVNKPVAKDYFSPWTFETPRGGRPIYDLRNARAGRLVGHTEEDD